MVLRVVEAIRRFYMEAGRNEQARRPAGCHMVQAGDAGGMGCRGDRVAEWGALCIWSRQNLLMAIELLWRSRKESGITSLPCASSTYRKDDRQEALRSSGTVHEAAGF